MLNNCQRRLLLINQSVGSLFEDVVTAGERLGDVTVLQGVAYSRASAIARLLTWLLFSIQLTWHLFGKGRRYSHGAALAHARLRCDGDSVRGDRR